MNYIVLTTLIDKDKPSKSYAQIEGIFSSKSKANDVFKNLNLESIEQYTRCGGKDPEYFVDDDFFEIGEDNIITIRHDLYELPTTE